MLCIFQSTCVLQKLILNVFIVELQSLFSLISKPTFKQKLSCLIWFDLKGVAGSMVLAPRSPPTALEPCRVAPYLPALRLHPPIQAGGNPVVTASANVSSAFDPAVLHYAATGGLFCVPPPNHPHHLSLAASLAAAAARSKNSSIADLRLKARRHQEALGLDRPA